MAIRNNAPYAVRRTRYNFGRVGVLMGGPSNEREISLKSGKTVCEALEKINVDIVGIDIKSEDKKENVQLIKSHKIDCAFIALHGRFGEDGQIQALLDELKVPYTGSGTNASRLGMDKIASRKIFEANGLRVPKFITLEKESYHIGRKPDKFNLPWVIKPATCGSSIGLSIIDREEKLTQAIKLAFQFDKKIIIEEFIAGREMTVGILEEEALPVIEIIPKKRFFDYEAKYQTGMTDYIVPAKLEVGGAKRMQSAAFSAYKLLGCCGCSRIDMILDKDNIPFILELNTIPGLTQISLLPKAARVAGIEFPDLCLRLIKLAYEKTQDKFTARDKNKAFIA